MLRKITAALQASVGTVTNRSRLDSNAIANRDQDKTGDRTALAYLTQPLTDSINRAWREK
jgi:hypothetical protein